MKAPFKAWMPTTRGARPRITDSRSLTVVTLEKGAKAEFANALAKIMNENAYYLEHHSGEGDI